MPESEGKAVTARIDLQMMMGLGQQIPNECDGRARASLRRILLDLQAPDQMMPSMAKRVPAFQD
ncbi:MAG TPA: hypothetical protein VGD52_22410 [Pseudoduganella sp.]